VRGRGRDLPLAFPDVLRVREEARIGARVQLCLPFVTTVEQLCAFRPQLALEQRDEVQRLTGEDPLVGRSGDLDLGESAQAAASSRSNCASSVEPLRARVELWGDTACATRSK